MRGDRISVQLLVGILLLAALVVFIFGVSGFERDKVSEMTAELETVEKGCFCEGTELFIADFPQLKEIRAGVPVFKNIKDCSIGICNCRDSPVPMKDYTLEFGWKFPEGECESDCGGETSFPEDLILERRSYLSIPCDKDFKINIASSGKTVGNFLIFLKDEGEVISLKKITVDYYG